MTATIPPAALATMRAAAEDALGTYTTRPADAAVDVIGGMLADLETAGWEVSVRRLVDRPAVPLSPRLREVLLLAAAGLSNDEIAAQLWLSREAVQSRMKNLFRLLDVRTRLDAVMTAVELGHVSFGELRVARAELAARADAKAAV
jgi:DNA-binding CsgD family transcriptional regulator